MAFRQKTRISEEDVKVGWIEMHGFILFQMFYGTTDC
jgi:hypothetical protein